MFPLSTHHKLEIARVLSRISLLALKGMGRDVERLRCRRMKLEWELDLREGIDLSIFLLGAFEPGLVRFLIKRLKPGMEILDIGANRGALTLPMARLVSPTGRVHAIEPTEWALTRLKRALDLNPELKSNVICSHAFVSFPNASIPSQVASSWNLWKKAEADQLHEGILESTTGSEPITIDGYVQKHQIQRIDLIKIDIDGPELTALQSARETLKRYTPIVVVEYSPWALRHAGTDPEALLSFLKEAGYQLRVLSVLGTLKLFHWRDVPYEGGVNLVCVR